MVERVRKSFEAWGTVKAASPGSPDKKKRTAKFMDELKGMIEADLTKSMRAWTAVARW